jgi:hypothetical protein
MDIIEQNPSTCLPGGVFLGSVTEKCYLVSVKMVMARLSALSFLCLCIACGTPRPETRETVEVAASAVEVVLETSLIDFAKRQTGDYYYAVYFSGIKIGWRALLISLEETKRGTRVIYDDETLFTLSLNGEVLKTTSRSRCVYRLKPPGLIESCEKMEVSNNDISSTTVLLENNQHAIAIDYNGQTRTLVHAPSRDTMEMAKTLDDWIFGNRKAGDTFELFGIDVDGLRHGRPTIDSESKVTFEGRKKARWKGEEVSLTLVRSLDDSGVVTHFQMLPSGVAIRIKAGPLEFRLEDKDATVDFSASKLDMAQTIPSNVFLGNPKDIVSLKLLLKTKEDFSLPETRRQRLLKGEKNELLIELVPEYLDETDEPLSDEEKRKYTSSTLLLPSDHREIRQLARTIIGEEMDPLRIADLLQSWVYLNIEKTYGSNTGSALTVLKNRAGDCTELALLFTALARSVGIPARELTGLIYDDLNNVFGWHAWAEIHNGHQWLSVDPTWNELFANATHVRLSKNDEDMASIALLNQLEIEVQSFKKKGQ